MFDPTVGHGRAFVVPDHLVGAGEVAGNEVYRRALELQAIADKAGPAARGREFVRAERALVQAHFKRFPLKPCPICRTNSWDTGGLECTMPWSTDDPMQSTGQVEHNPESVIATVPLVCHTCGYIIRFSWNAIRKSSGHVP